MATIYDVAARAGVSPATVSRYFTGGGVSAARATAIAAAADALQFVPNRNAQRLRTQSSQILAMLVPDIANPFFMQMVRAVTDIARRAGLSVMLGNTDDDPEIESGLIRAAVADQVAGLIVAPTGPSTSLEFALAHRVPVVCVDRSAPGFDVDTVVTDSVSGGQSATEELLRAGFSRIGCVSGPEGVTTADLRVAGWRAAMVAATGAVPPDAWLFRGPYTIETGEFGAEMLRGLPDPVDAIFAANNTIAVGVVRHLLEMGTSLERVQVSSLGELPLALYVPQGMIVTHLPAREIGTRAAELLLDRIAGFTGSARSIVLPTVVTDDQHAFGPPTRTGVKAMMTYAVPSVAPRPAAEPKTIYTVASGDLRLATNVKTWDMQQKVEAQFAAALEGLGWRVKRAHDVDPVKGHGFIDNQRRGMDVFAAIPPEAPVVVVEAVWQYSHHVLAGLRDHHGPILLVANFAGDFPGLVGLLNLTGSLTKAGIKHSTLWSEDFSDTWAKDRLKTWLETGEIVHDLSHVRDLPALPDSPEKELGVALGAQLRNDKAVLAIFDEYCMGMYNALIDDELMNPTGMYKERLSQSALYAEMLTVTEDEAAAIRSWLDAAGMTFHVDNEGDWRECLTDEQLTWQFKMYIAALRIADDFGAAAVGIQYQQGLKDLVPASDLAEGLLNDPNRPPVKSRDGARVLYEGRALPHFNEVDQGVAMDALVTNRVWEAMGLDPSTTLHDVRWGDYWDGDFVWVLEISGSVPASHLGGYSNAHSYRQSNYFFPLGGGTLSGVSKPGEIVWSRVFVEDGGLHVDLGRGTCVGMPDEEVQRRLNSTNKEWPIMNAILHGVTRDQLMGRHRSNHLNVVYAPDAQTADKALVAKAAMFSAIGIKVHLCGDVLNEL